jgi:DNA-binding NarL/FixJ family response regulator
MGATTGASPSRRDGSSPPWSRARGSCRWRAATTCFSPTSRRGRSSCARSKPFSATPARRNASPGLTPREGALLELLARGLDNHQIAAHLDLSEKTVRNMVSSVLGKLGVETRAQAIVHARDAGYGTSTPAS